MIDFHAIVYGSSPSLPVKYSYRKDYCRIKKKTNASLRRVLYRVFYRRPHSLHTINGGVYEPPVVRIERSYPIATVACHR
jgi:hypothetical protein